MKYLKPVLAFIIAFIMRSQVFVISFADNKPNVTISLSKSKIDMEEEVTVTIKFSGKGVSGIEFSIDYDETLLNYKSASGFMDYSGLSSGSGKGGIWYSGSESVSSKSFTIVYVAKNAGKAKISVSDIKVCDANGNIISGFKNCSADLTINQIEIKDTLPLIVMVETYKDGVRNPKIYKGDIFEVRITIRCENTSIWINKGTYSFNFNDEYFSLDHFANGSNKYISKSDVLYNIRFDNSINDNHVCCYLKALLDGEHSFLVKNVEGLYITNDNKENNKSFANKECYWTDIYIHPKEGFYENESEKTYENGSEAITEKGIAEYKVRTAGDPLNIRSGAGTNYGVIDQIPNGVTIDFVESNGEWSKITYNGKTGWVASEYITEIAEKTETTDLSTSEENTEVSTSETTSATEKTTTETAVEEKTSGLNKKMIIIIAALSVIMIGLIITVIILATKNKKQRMNTINDEKETATEDKTEV